MASVKKNKRSINPNIRKKRSLRLREGKIATYINVIEQKIKNADELINIIEETLATYGKFFDSVEDHSSLGENGKIAIECCDEIHKDCQRLTQLINEQRVELKEFIANRKNENAFTMHVRAQQITTAIEAALDTHAKLFQISLSKVNELKFD